MVIEFGGPVSSVSFDFISNMFGEEGRMFIETVAAEPDTTEEGVFVGFEC